MKATRIAASILALSVCTHTVAAPGDLDTGFGASGRVLLDAGTSAREATSIVTLPDGRYYVSGTAWGWETFGSPLFRFGTNHLFDASYGYGGNAAGNWGIRTAIRSLGDGRVLAAENVYRWVDTAGAFHRDVLVARYDAAGNVDTTFGSAGRTAIFNAGVGGEQRFNALAIAPDGKIVAAGYTTIAGGKTKAIVARFDANGVADPTFGTAGILQLPDQAGTPANANVGFEEIRGVDVFPNGVIVLSGVVTRATAPTNAGFAAWVYPPGHPNGNATQWHGVRQVYNGSPTGGFQCNGVLVTTAARAVLACGYDGNATLVAVTTTGLDVGLYYAMLNLGSGTYTFRNLVAGAAGTVYAIGNRTSGAANTIVSKFLANGQLDNAFGFQGTASFGFLSGAAIAMHADGLIVGGTLSAGRMGLQRLSPDTGAVVSALPTALEGTSSTSFGSVAILGDGRLMVGGTAGEDFASTFLSARLAANGTLDTSYGVGGYSQVTIPNMDFLVGVRDMAVQPDGKVLVTGDFGGCCTAFARIGVARLVDSGTGDPAFNAAGTPGYNYVDAGTTPPPVFSRAVELQADGRILVLGSGVASGMRQLALARFNADGTLDGTYGTAGVAMPSFADATTGRHLAITHDGKGIGLGSGAGRIQLARFATSGALDASFGTGGMVSFAMPAGYSLNVPNAVFALPDGKVIVLASVTKGVEFGAMALRFGSDGSLDLAYGGGQGFGFVPTLSNVAAANSNFFGGALTPNGKLVAVGQLGPEGGVAAAIARFNADGTPDTGWGTGGYRAYPDAFAAMELHNLAVAPDGALYVAGKYDPASEHRGLVLKTQADASAVTVALVASVPSIAFGGQSVGTTSPSIPVTIRNTGLVQLTLGAVTPSDPQFSATNDCAVIAPLGTCTLQLRFSPATFSGSLNTTQAVNGTVTITTSHGGTATVTLSGTAQRSLVAHYYRAILVRAPDAAGQTFWENEAARLAALGVNINEVWFVMAGYFFNSAEYAAANKTDAQFVTDIYNTFFNRPPDQGGFDFWMSQINAGLSREGVMFWFMFSNEFRTFTQGIFGNAAARPEVDMVMDLFRGILNRLPDTPAVNSFVSILREAQCQAPSARAGAVYKAVNDISYFFIFDSGEYAARNRTNKQYVSDMYNAFLRRGGAVSEVDFWIGQLDSQAKDRNQLRADFIASGEFAARVQAVIDAGCLQ